MSKRSRLSRRAIALGLVLMLVIGLALAKAWRRYGADWWEDKVDARLAALAPLDVPDVPIVYHVATSHPRILLDHPATRERLVQRLQSATPAAARFRQFVDSQLAGGDNYGFEPWQAALMYRLTGETAYADYAIARTDAAVASEEALIARDKPAAVADDSYLGVGPVIGSLSLVFDWCHDRLTPAQRSRWITYGNQAVWNVWNPSQARWGDKTFAWTGWSVDNPSNNYYYSFLHATMFLGLATLGENDSAQEWLDTFRVKKLERQLFPIFRRDLQGGGSREGTGYGTAMRTLFMLFDWWERSTGERLADKTPHPLQSMAFLMHSTVPTLDRLAPTGDHSRDSSAALFDYHRDYLLALIALYPHEPVAGVARTFLEQSSVPRMQQGFDAWSDFLYGDPDVPARPLAALPTAYHGAGTGQVMLRSDWTPSASFANVICGPYTESHAHRDQGSFVLYRDGWLAQDENIASRSGLERAEMFHNLLRFEVDGRVVQQRNGPACTLEALADDADFSFLRADLVGAYRGQSAVKSDQREFFFFKPSTFVVYDRAEVAPGVQRIWTLNVPQRPDAAGERLQVASANAHMEVLRLWPRGLPTQVTGWADAKEQLTGGYRVEAVDDRPGDEPFLHVLRLGGGTLQASARRSAAGLDAVVDLDAGAQAILHFAADPGATTLRLVGGDGRVRFDGPLPNKVAELPTAVH